MIGGRVEEGETPLQAAIREAHEELGKVAIFNPEQFKFIMDFDEIATSDPNLKIHFMYLNTQANCKDNLLPLMK